MRPLGQVCLAVSIAAPTPAQNQEPRTETHLHRSSAGSWQTLPRPSEGLSAGLSKRACGRPEAQLQLSLGWWGLWTWFNPSKNARAVVLEREASCTRLTCQTARHRSVFIAPDARTHNGGTTTAGFIGFPGPPIVLCTTGRPPQKASINPFFAGLFSPTLWQ